MTAKTSPIVHQSVSLLAARCGPHLCAAGGGGFEPLRLYEAELESRRFAPCCRICLLWDRDAACGGENLADWIHQDWKLPLGTSLTQYGIRLSRRANKMRWRNASPL